MDTPETLAAALVKSAAEAIVGTRVIAQASAKVIKTEARNNALASAPRLNAGAPYAITYDTQIHPTSIEAEIGYDKDKPGGALGNLLEFGGGKDHSPPHRDLGRAHDAEAPRFLNAIDEMVGRLL